MTQYTGRALTPQISFASTSASNESRVGARRSRFNGQTLFPLKISMLWGPHHLFKTHGPRRVLRAQETRSMDDPLEDWNVALSWYTIFLITLLFFCSYPSTFSRHSDSPLLILLVANRCLPLLIDPPVDLHRMRFSQPISLKIIRGTSLSRANSKMQFIYILLPLFYSVGSLASPGPNDKVTQYNCANHIYSEAEVGNFFKAAAVELAKTQMGQPPKMPLLNPYEPKPSSPSLKHEYFSFYAARLKGLKVMKFVVINEAQKRRSP